MATRIRLRRVGRKREALYRIVVADQAAPRDGRSVATLGHYHPKTTPAVVKLDVERARAWLARGAVPTNTVRSLLKQAGVFAAPAAGAPSAGA